ncbi:MAG TPA: 30S ribosomal protein S15 [Candidatus Saccharimonadales bacterium]|jgi:small subunit ribosomal protein S15|nr:30S ribosomal protein S15 [Candidatus Saccharimonadales bacterium]
MITKENKTKIMTEHATTKNDVGSPQVQVAVLTARIKEVTEHLKEHKHDRHGRRGLLQMVGQRKRFLKYIERKDFTAYQELIAKLGLRK